MIDPDHAREAGALLASGSIVVLPTDTLYALAASALDPEAVSRVYKIKRRDPAKPLIVLVEDVDAIERFGVVLSDALQERLRSYWPGPYSILLPTQDEEFEYLHRGTHEIAFRVPDDPGLCSVLASSGPIVAPSANPEGLPPAKDVREATRYFGTDVDHYIDDGPRVGPASTLLRVEEDGTESVLRRP